jgi:hypothetical protein
LLRHAVILALGWTFHPDLTGQEETRQLIPDANGHGGIAKSREASNGFFALAGVFGQFVLNFEARGAGPAVLRHEAAKGILMLLAAMRDLPRLHGAQAQRQPCRVAESALVILKNARLRNLLDQLLVSIFKHAEA